MGGPFTGIFFSQKNACALLFHLVSAEADQRDVWVAEWNVCCQNKNICALSSYYYYPDCVHVLLHFSCHLPAEANSSRMFEGFPTDLMKALTQEPLTGNFHHYGVTVEVQEKCLWRLAPLSPHFSSPLVLARIFAGNEISGYCFNITPLYSGISIRWDWKPLTRQDHIVTCCFLLFLKCIKKQFFYLFFHFFRFFRFSMSYKY